ncbi:response regulator [Alkalimarinus coralli]|uniref:response regulator n=1 Tax=Alkalimarinus coralli TaxID=2935863 RepID=UPI00202B5083|nr:response regulator [Alkalimarinus coralli]
MTSCILAIAVALSDWLVFKSAKELILSSTLKRMEGTLSLEIERITREIDETRDQAQQLANSPIVQGFLFARENQQYDPKTESTEGEWRRRLEEHFSRLIESKRYLQVRLIDTETGRELVRVNHPKKGLIPEPVRGDNLQNKSDTRYVINGRELKNGEVYISDITLNRESGKLEEPYQPTQRIVAPVFFDADTFTSGTSLSGLELAEQLRSYGQQRTLAAMRIAQSGNLAWHSRYEQTIHKLNIILDKLEYMSPEEGGILLKKLRLHHSNLQKAEQRVIDTASFGQLINATREIIGESYWSRKEAFKNTLEELILTFESEYITSNYKRRSKALLVINTNASMLLQTLENKRSETIMLVNAKGQYIYHPDKSKRWIFEHDPATRDIRHDEPWVWQAISETHNTRLSFDEHGELHITGKVLFTNNDRHRFLGLVVTRTKEDVLAPIEAFKAQSIYSAILAIILSGLAIAVFTHRQLKPITLLTEQAKQITAGSSSTTLSIPGAKGEVKTMVSAFETLISQLQQQTQEANENARAVSQLAETLDLRVKERTAQLAESMHKAEAASVAKSQFLATMSHEIRTPMNGVLGMAQLLAKSDLTSQQQYYLNTINQSGEALLSIINDILDFSKIESGKLELDPIEFDLEHVAHDALHLLATTAAQKGIELIFNYDIHSARYFKGDPGRIRQILINLVGNSIKFTEKGHIQLNIYYRESEPAPLRFEVIDSGIGISKEKQENLFEAFTQADASTTRRYGGTGLGLTICKRLIDLMGGSIGVTSEPGKGTKFWFNLPLAVSQKPARLARADLAGIKALIVDDSHTNCVILEELLVHWGVDVTIATTHSESLRKIDSAISDGSPFQLVILDYMMPGCDGFELGQQIKNKYHIPQVMLTSSPDQNKTETLRSAGISVCLTKPYKSETLKDALEIALIKSSDKLQHEPLSQYGVDEQRTAMPENVKLTGHVLLVEDNKVNQEVAKGFLSQLGLIVDIADNGLEALKRWKSTEYDLILMDCLMPVMDGYEASRMIREQETGKSHTPIIALTANVMNSDKQNCEKAGMDDFLGKPIEQDELVRKLCHWLNSTKKEPTDKEQQGITPPHAETSAKDTGPTVMDNIPVVDETHFTRMSSQLSSRFQQIVDSYVEESQDIINEFKLAGEQGDTQTMVRAVHSLKSSSGALGAQQLSKLAAGLEQRYTDGLTDSWETDLHDIERVYHKTRVMMDSLNKTLHNS